ncbi:ABC transporter ATP-binding protein [Planomonospora sp. ID82291]|uniref:ABC transporter ATP-binding protein n=1 Tax=Planomonospora sp. ID82291 TaxID=2738136 RepID=UPI0018C35310|nr:ABC transporter ATP-binding protein [Planomonospora sp. ID82291]MBG0812789.1 ABC transporter ATP-binding protein [Planomonospora sp. ID82291]
MDTSTTPDLLHISGISKFYSNSPILKNISFSLLPGEALAVIGPNGSGKTTLLKCVAGIEGIDEGVITLSGKEVRESDPAVRAAMACLLDDADYFPDLSVIDHLTLYAWAHGAADPDGVVESVMHELDLRTAADQLPITLSSGQRHRLGLASCLVRPRRVLLLDEPEQRLDAKGRAWLTSRFQAEKAAGVGILFSSHDPELIDATADRIIEVPA